MKKLILTFIACMAVSSVALADDPKARDIMQSVNDRDDGDNRISTMDMFLIDKNKKQRHRQIRSFSKDKGDDTQSLMFFTSPADVARTGFLTWDYKGVEKDDDQWLFLPALKKTKRIVSNDKSGSFMGSDLSYADLTKRELDNYDFFLKKEMKVGAHPVWVIEALPRSKEIAKKDGYTKSLLLVRQDNYVVVRSVGWIEGSQDLKFTDVKKLKQIDGIWIETETHITRKRGKKVRHKTILKTSDIKFNQPLKAGFFSVRQMEKGL